MKERPIIFSAPMVRAILDGRKTQTRRPIRKGATRCPYGEAGDRLWVREAAYIAPAHFFAPIDCNCIDDDGEPRVVDWKATMDADAIRCATEFGVKRTPSIFMPRWAARITLEVLRVRTEHVQDIGNEDIAAEGADSMSFSTGWGRSWFADAWDAIHVSRSAYKWAANPLVWVVEFKLLEARGAKWQP